MFEFKTFKIKHFKHNMIDIVVNQYVKLNLFYLLELMTPAKGFLVKMVKMTNFC